MRCWHCQAIIVLPDTIGGVEGAAEKGKPGAIRAGLAKPIDPPHTQRSEFTCGRCGASYVQVTQLVKVRARVATEEVRDGDNGR